MITVYAESLRRDGSRPFSPCAAPFLAFETEHYRVVFKPAGMHSLPAPRIGRGTQSQAAGARDPFVEEDEPGEGLGDLLSWFRAKFPDQADGFGAKTGHENTQLSRVARESGMLSRLDRATSGLIAFARSPEVFSQAREAQASGRTGKRYWLLARESLHEEGLIGSAPRLLSWGEGDPVSAGRDFSVECNFRSYGPRGYRVACVAPELFTARPGRAMKSASPVLYRSDFHPLPQAHDGLMEGWPEIPGCLALEANISAGFRHQIRAHMAWCGHPIAGDSLYGVPGDQEEANLPSARLFLECHRIELESPDGGGEIFELARSPSLHTIA